LKQAAAYNDRKSKRYDRADMRERALAMDAKHNDQARLISAEAQQRLPIRLAQDEIAARAQEALTFARDNAVEREAVADMRQVITDALRRNLGRTTVEAVTTELRLRQERGEFIDIAREQRPPEATTERTVRMEKENIQTVMDGKGTCPAIVRASRVKDVVANAIHTNQLRLDANQQSAVETVRASRVKDVVANAAQSNQPRLNVNQQSAVETVRASRVKDVVANTAQSNHLRLNANQQSAVETVRASRVKDVVANAAQSNQLRLNANQQSAVETILSSNDRIVGLQGGAGTGKTTALSVLRVAAEEEGYQVQGFAPTTRAAQQLAESGIETETLQKFLRRRQQPAIDKRLFVVDESSLASTKQLNKFFARLKPQDKVLLVGDVRQHQAVEAGSPFEQLQQHGMTTAKLNEIVRQRDPELKQTVEKLSTRQIREAVAGLDSQGKVIEISNERERLEAMAQDYCKSPTNTLVISPANRERVQLNSLIHRQLQRDGKVSRDEQHMKVYVNRQDMTGTERTFANSYRPGEDTIRYNHASKVYKVNVGDYAKVTGTNHETNEITVRFDNGRILTYDPTRLSGVSVYNEAKRVFAEGDRIQFRAPFTDKRIVNGELGSITRLEPGQMRVSLDSGRDVAFDPQQFRHIDYGYAVTSHSSQGLTVDRVLVNADTRESLQLLNDRMAYVAVSRAREEALIYTDSAQNLRDTLNRGTDKEMALKALKDRLRDVQQDHDPATHDPLAPQSPKREHGMDHGTTQIDPTQAKAAELAVESEQAELGAALLL
jgi:ATP-dependent exoDNAse (exonuclease V) alpha subunit